MKRIWIYLLLLISATAMGQVNLVPNPSFEDTVICPDHGGNIDEATGWINCGITPDYYNSCANISFPPLGVPNSYYTGYQYAFDGNAYGGLGIYQYPSVAHEFIAIQLTQPLIAGTKYFVSSYISKADNYLCASNNFGFKFFTNISFSSTNPAPIDNFSHIHSTYIITDSLNWTQIAGSFIADSAYQFLVIGNFYDNMHTSVLNCDTTAGDLAYYLIDAVCVSSDSLTCYDWTDIENINKNVISIYPNPADEMIYIKNLSADVPYSIANAIGAKIDSGILNKQNGKINTTSFENGLYLLLIDNENFYKILIIH